MDVLATLSCSDRQTRTHTKSIRLLSIFWSSSGEQKALLKPYPCFSCGIGSVDVIKSHPQNHIFIKVENKLIKFPFPKDLLVETCSTCDDYSLTLKDTEEIDRELTKRYYRCKINQILEL